MRTINGTTASILGVLAIAGGLGITALAAGTATAAGADSDAKHAVVRTFTTQTTQFAVIDVGPPGPPGQGDQIISADTVLRGGTAVGTDGVVCTVVKATPEALTCQWVMTMNLPEGSITLQGMADSPPHKPTEPLTFGLAVTGGTGAYRGTTGSAVIVDNPDETEQITLRLSR